MASDSAETSDISKGGAALAAKSAARRHVEGRCADGRSFGGWSPIKSSQPPMGVRRSAHAPLSLLRPCALRLVPLPGMSLKQPHSGHLPAPHWLLVVPLQVLTLQWRPKTRNKAFMKDAADNGYLPEVLKGQNG
jgi:hypothetical protein